MPFDVFALRDRVLGSGRFRELRPYLRPPRRGVRPGQAGGGRAVAGRGPPAQPGVRARRDPGRTRGERHAHVGDGALLRRFAPPASAPGRGDRSARARRALHRLDRHRVGQEPDLSRPDRRPRAARRSRRHSVRAIIVYPMNALINSQLEALRSFARRTGRTARSASPATRGRTSGTRRGRRSSTTRRTSCSPTT